ncbi:MAG TPA: nuclear transport factor 2 family protein, partial [Steroidobacteraceae bacterium]|nr:nuclear transport factor 2 family protein [Steroidobacteraceae bacterium]
MTRPSRWKAALGPLVIAVLAAGPASGDAQPDAAAAEAKLRGITQEMMDAIAPGHAEVWERYLDERLIHVDENGIVRGKAELLAELKPLPPGLVGRIQVERFRMALHGETAVAAYELQEHLDYHGQILRSRFRTTDTWLKTARGWRLIGTQTAAVLKDPPAVTLSRAQLCEYDGSYAL